MGNKLKINTIKGIETTTQGSGSGDTLTPDYPELFTRNGNTVDFAPAKGDIDNLGMEVNKRLLNDCSNEKIPFASESTDNLVWGKIKIDDSTFKNAWTDITTTKAYNDLPKVAKFSVDWRENGGVKEDVTQGHLQYIANGARVWLAAQSTPYYLPNTSQPEVLVNQTGAIANAIIPIPHYTTGTEAPTLTLDIVLENTTSHAQTTLQYTTADIGNGSGGTVKPYTIGTVNGTLQINDVIVATTTNDAASNGGVKFTGTGDGIKILSICGRENIS